MCSLVQAEGLKGAHGVKKIFHTYTQLMQLGQEALNLWNDPNLEVKPEMLSEVFDATNVIKRGVESSGKAEDEACKQACNNPDLGIKQERMPR